MREGGLLGLGGAPWCVFLAKNYGQKRRFHRDGGKLKSAKPPKFFPGDSLVGCQRYGFVGRSEAETP